MLSIHLLVVGSHQALDLKPAQHVLDAEVIWVRPKRDGRLVASALLLLLLYSLTLIVFVLNLTKLIQPLIRLECLYVAFLGRVFQSPEV